MKRAKVIVHMYTSIDGKIDGNHGSGISGAYYSDVLYEMSNAVGNGRTTMQLVTSPEPLDLTPFQGSQIEKKSWLPDIKSDTWSVSFDRKGQVNWPTSYFEYNGHKMQAIEILTKQVKPEYLAFLQSMKIPYIISGETDYEFEEVLEILKSHFGIETLAVSGGAGINGAFLEKHLVDEISLVMSPVVNGDPNILSSFNTHGMIINDQFGIKSLKKLPDGGVHLIFAKK